jgi:hypothetical protein
VVGQNDEIGRLGDCGRGGWKSERGNLEERVVVAEVDGCEEVMVESKVSLYALGWHSTLWIVR